MDRHYITDEIKRAITFGESSNPAGIVQEFALTYKEVVNGQSVIQSKVITLQQFKNGTRF
jgi:hypothetical protein